MLSDGTLNGAFLKSMTNISRVLVRVCDIGTLVNVDITTDATIQDVINILGGSPDHEIFHLKRDVFKKVASTSILPRSAPILHYTHCPGDMDQPCNEDEDSEETTTVDEECTNSADNSITDCVFWYGNVSSVVRVFFNPYTRMVLGLPTWYLDIPISSTTRCVELERLVHGCLGMNQEDDRFALFGNYRSHCSEIEAAEFVMPLSREEDPENNHFWQYMMLPTHEKHLHIGVTRQSSLLYRRGVMSRTLKYQFSLQGTSIYYTETADTKKKGPRYCIKNIDKCQVIYRGGSSSQKKFLFELIEPSGRIHRLKSPSRRRIEKWVDALRGCHDSCEINEPINMEMITKWCTPQEHPSAVPERQAPTPHPVIQSRRPTIEDLIPYGATYDGTAFSQDTTCAGTRKSVGNSEVEVDVLLRRIEMAAETLATRTKLRRKEALLWTDYIKLFMGKLLRVEHPDYGAHILMEMCSLLREVKNFLDLVEGRSEFEPMQDQVAPFIESIMDSCNCLFILYRGFVEEHGGEECPPLLKDTRLYKQNKIDMLRARQLLKRPFSRIDPEVLINGKTFLGNEGKGQKQKKETKASKKEEDKETTDKNKSEDGLMGWWSKMISKRRVKIPAEEVKELSISEPANNQSIEKVTQDGLPTPLKKETLAVKESSTWKTIKDGIRGGGKKVERREGGLYSITEDPTEEEKNETMLPVFNPPAPRVTKPYSPVKVIINETTIASNTFTGEGERCAVPPTTPLRVYHESNESDHSTSSSKSFAHRRSQSTRSTSVSFNQYVEEFQPSPTSEEETTERTSRRTMDYLTPKTSTVEIDPVLLSALMKDPRLSKLILPQTSPREGRTGHSRSFSSGGPTRQNSKILSCGVCRQVLEEGKDEILRTPFDQFHQNCLKCHDCGRQLSTNQFRFENGKVACRDGTCIKMEESLSSTASSINSPRPIKGILKKASAYA